MFSVFKAKTLFMAGIFLLTIWAQSPISASEIPKDFLQLSKKLYNMEEDYWKKREKSEWQAIYEYQHPKFKKKVSIEEFRYFDGRVAHNYREEKGKHISGMMVPSIEQIKKRQSKKDILGFPIHPTYKILSNGLMKIQNHAVEKIFISKDKKHAKAVLKVDVKGRLNPGIVRGNVPYQTTLEIEDFWEYQDGKWVIPLLENPVNMSGIPTSFYYKPENLNKWKEMDFIEIERRHFALNAN